MCKKQDKNINRQIGPRRKQRTEKLTRFENWKEYVLGSPSSAGNRPTGESEQNQMPTGHQDLIRCQSGTNTRDRPTPGNSLGSLLHGESPRKGTGRRKCMWCNTAGCPHSICFCAPIPHEASIRGKVPGSPSSAGNRPAGVTEQNKEQKIKVKQRELLGKMKTASNCRYVETH